MEPFQPQPVEPQDAALPAPATARWQPLRSGLLNLYRYDEQEFRFDSGHLLLRGNNGTGKSRVLALQLPFLFDGEIRPERVEPDGDPAKRMEWNLLLGKYPDRLGYTWIEFGRVDDDGAPLFLTLGCGLQAASGRGVHNRWYFVTPARVGRDLYLQTAGGQPLTRARLTELLDGRGKVLTTAEAYRREVDRELFHLGEHRYQALVNLLIQLRQPQLSRKLDERKLSDALGEALAPLSDAVLADVGEAMRGLEHERNELAALRAAGDGVRAFATGYRRYAQVAARRRARVVRTLHADYEETMRGRRDAERRRDAARVELGKAAAALSELAVVERRLEAEVETLTASPQMDRARELDRARREVDERTRELQQATEELAGADRRHRELLDRKEVDERLAAQALQAVEARSDEARDLAEPVGLARDHAAALLDLPEQTDVASVAVASDLLEEAASRRDESARQLRAVDQQFVAAEQRLTLARSEQDRREAALTEARERHQAATQALEAGVDGYLDAYAAWRRAAEELELPDAETLEDDVREWSERGEGPNPLRLAVESAVRDATRRLERRDAGVRQQLEALTVERDALSETLSRFESGYEEPPPAPHTRNPELRDRRPGAPLWRLCDFAPGLAAAERAGLEAALEASGLLDAWVTPDGALIDPDDHDRVLVGFDASASAGAHVGRWIQPVALAEPNAPPEAVVRLLLEQIGGEEGAGPVWVSPSGRWQVGPLRGAWSKADAQYVGPQARARHRERRSAELTRDLRALDQRSRELAAEQAEIQRGAERVLAAAEAAPSDDAILRAGADLQVARRQSDACRERLRVAEAETIQRRTERDARRDERDQLAADLRLERWVTNLDGLAEALNRYRVALAGLWPAIRSQVQARAAVERIALHVQEVAEERRRWSVREQEAREKVGAAEAQRQALEDAAGADVGEILARVAEARAEQKQASRRRDALRDDQAQLRVDENSAVKDLQSASAALELCHESRGQAIVRLRRYAETGLLQDAAPALGDTVAEDWSVKRAVEIARRLEDTLQDVPSDDPDWERVQNTCRAQFEELQQALRANDYQPTMSIEDDLWRVTVPFRGRECTVAELHRELDDEVGRHQEILSHREKEIIQNHLIGEVAQHLHERIREGEELVREMNAELESRPTSTGMRLRFTWRPVDDGPTGLAEARKRLLAASSTWSEADRESLGNFLQEQIQRVREANLTGTWQEHLAEAMDYRRWHFFGVERQQDGRWQRLTRRTHGTGSGGEKAIALTIPQFAAAAAHYRTADRHAPRLILLDEAFVGVDSDMRSKCMGLLAAFDLDFVMTSEREWGCYATLPGLAIYQLSTRPGIDAIGVTRWVWNGHERVRDVAVAPTMRAPRDAGDRPLEAPGPP